MPRRGPKPWRTLAVLLQALRGYVVVVEQKNGGSIRGRIEAADLGMNVVMNDVTATSSQGITTRMDQLFLAGRSVRYVHIPVDVDVPRLLDAHRNNTAKHARTYQRGIRKGVQRVLRRASGRGGAAGGGAGRGTRGSAGGGAGRGAGVQPPTVPGGTGVRPAPLIPRSAQRR